MLFERTRLNAWYLLPWILILLSGCAVSLCGGVQMMSDKEVSQYWELSGCSSLVEDREGYLSLAKVNRFLSAQGNALSTCHAIPSTYISSARSDRFSVKIQCDDPVQGLKARNRLNTWYVDLQQKQAPS